MSDYTYGSVFWMYSLMGLFAVGSVFFLVRAIQTGAVSGDETPKYRMLEDDDERLAEAGGHATHGRNA